MKSSQGSYFIALDHVRALAALMVFAWHFTHTMNGYPVAFSYTPEFIPFSLFNEGHTGVALFMCLSGYLFSKLLDGKKIDFKAFLWNRFLRLFPLLFLIILAFGIKNYIDGNFGNYIISICKGVIFPTLPNGGWSITVEFHFYLILPLILWFLNKTKYSCLFFLVLAVSFRTIIYQYYGEVQTSSYWTIIGRFDQFLLGMFTYHSRKFIIKNNILVLFTSISFVFLFWSFDLEGGFYKNPSYPSSNAIWIILPTLEGIAYSTFIAWYDGSFEHSTNGISRFIGKLGEYSYSIYLLHPFIVFRSAKYINENLMDISNFYVAFGWSICLFIFMFIPGYLSFKFIEMPFLKFRKPYIIHL